MRAIHPEELDYFHSDLNEYCFYQYLPVKMAGFYEVKIPEQLRSFGPLVMASMSKVDRIRDNYVYLTVKMGWATTENPLNRPGWHVDAWGHPEDRNFVWTDRYPTVYVIGEIGEVAKDDDMLALKAFEAAGQRMHHFPVKLAMVYEFGQAVVHATPVIETPGVRRFAKVSISPHKYNLEGNAHNYLFNYKWEMKPRADVRNDPVAGNSDYA